MKHLKGEKIFTLEELEMNVNKRVAEELRRTLQKLSYFSQDLNDRLYEFEHNQDG